MSTKSITLRFLGILAICSLLPACAHIQHGCADATDEEEFWCAPGEDGLLGCFHAPKSVQTCPSTFNVVQCFFSDADFQGETEEQTREVRRALMDALELPIDELRKPRYADYQGIQNQRTFDQLINAHFVSEALIRGWGKVDANTQGFYPALKLPESLPVLKHWIQKLE